MIFVSVPTKAGIRQLYNTQHAVTNPKTAINAAQPAAYHSD
jgi:hypothetical protein